MIPMSRIYKMTRAELDETVLEYGLKIPEGCSDIVMAHHVIVELSLMHRLLVD